MVKIMKKDEMVKKTDMSQKVCIITGANSGIGYWTAMELAKMNAEVIMVCRNEKKGNIAQKQIIDLSNNNLVELFIADLSSIKSIKEVSKKIHEKYTKLDVLINNAGLIMPKRELTIDGFERVFATNYIAPFLLTNLLLDIITANGPSRIVNVSADLHKMGTLDFDNLQSEKKFSGIKTYAQSKIAQNMFTFSLADKLKNSNVTVNALHPGVVRSNFANKSSSWILTLGMNLGFFYTQNSQKGAKTSIYLASSPEVSTISGKYFRNKKIVKTSKICQNKSLQDSLWNKTEELIKMKFEISPQ